MRQRQDISSTGQTTGRQGVRLFSKIMDRVRSILQNGECPFGVVAIAVPQRVSPSCEALLSLTINIAYLSARLPLITEIPLSDKESCAHVRRVAQSLRQALLRQPLSDALRKTLNDLEFFLSAEQIDQRNIPKT